MENEFLYALDLFGTFVFAITGAVKAVKNRLDFLGVLVFAMTVGCAGGMIRDVLLGTVPVSAYQNGSYILVSLAAGLLVFIFASKAVGRWSLIVYADAIGLGVFTALGCAKAAEAGVGAVGIVFSGTLTAVGGGVLRDMFVHEIPMIFASDFYASAAIFGGLFFLLLSKLGMSGDYMLILTAVFTIALRVIGYRMHFSLPVARMHGEDR